MDPLTLARLWLLVRPIKRLKERRAAKRAAKHQWPASEDESFNYQESVMSEGQLSMLRTVLKIAGTALASHGVLDAMDLPALQIAVESVAGGLIALAGIYLSHKKHAAA